MLGRGASLTEHIDFIQTVTKAEIINRSLHLVKKKKKKLFYGLIRKTGKLNPVNK